MKIPFAEFSLPSDRVSNLAVEACRLEHFAVVIGVGEGTKRTQSATRLRSNLCGAALYPAPPPVSSLDLSPGGPELGREVLHQGRRRPRAPSAE